MVACHNEARLLLFINLGLSDTYNLSRHRVEGEYANQTTLIISSFNLNGDWRHEHCSWEVADLVNGTEARDSQEKSCLRSKAERSARDNMDALPL